MQPMIPNWNEQSRHVFLLALSLAVSSIMLGLSYRYGFGSESAKEADVTRLMPYLTATAGVLLFVMDTARRKRATWHLARHWGDHVFRVAQAHAYLYLVLRFWLADAGIPAEVVDGVEGARPPDPNAAASTPESPTTPLSFEPNLIGFLVGLFILRVERAVGALGERFEDILLALFSRAFSDVKRAERRRNAVRSMYRLEDITTQWETLRGQIEDLGARDQIDLLIDRARRAAEGDDADAASEAVLEASRAFETARLAANETSMSVDRLLPPQ